MTDRFGKRKISPSKMNGSQLNSNRNPNNVSHFFKNP